MRYVEIKNGVVVTGITELPAGLPLPDLSSANIQVVEITSPTLTDAAVFGKLYSEGVFSINLPELKNLKKLALKKQAIANSQDTLNVSLDGVETSLNLNANDIQEMYQDTLIADELNNYSVKDSGNIAVYLTKNKVSTIILHWRNRKRLIYEDLELQLSAVDLATTEVSLNSIYLSNNVVSSTNSRIIKYTSHRIFNTVSYHYIIHYRDNFNVFRVVRTSLGDGTNLSNSSYLEIDRSGTVPQTLQAVEALFV